MLKEPISLVLGNFILLYERTAYLERMGKVYFRITIMHECTLLMFLLVQKALKGLQIISSFLRPREEMLYKNETEEVLFCNTTN